MVHAAGPPIAYGAHLVGAGAVSGAVGAGRATMYVGGHGWSMLNSAFNASALRAADIFAALNEIRKERRERLALTGGGSSSTDLAHHSTDLEHVPDETALEVAGPPALEGVHRRGRNSTPPRRSARIAARNAEPLIQEVSRPVFEHSYKTPEGWLQFSKNRGTLVEEIYKRSNWREHLGVTAEKNEIRQKLLKLKPKDLAQMLVDLDSL